ncbi:MAG: 2-keto-4-pentenoate hydratase [Acidimicrobiales bacterium]
MIDVAALAIELHSAMQTAHPVALITERHPDLDWADARAIAIATDHLRLAAGETRIGYKLGWTSAAMREAIGIDQPNWGTLWQSQFVTGELDLANFIHPKLEPELVWRAGPDLDIRSGEWALGIEVVDPRFPSFDFHFLDNTADNSSSAGVAVGRFSPVDSANLPELEVTIDDGATARTGAGANAMGSPVAALEWLIAELANEGRSIRPGEIVFTGGLTAPYDLEATANYTLSSPTLESVTLTAR